MIGLLDGERPHEIKGPLTVASDPELITEMRNPDPNEPLQPREPTEPVHQPSPEPYDPREPPSPRRSEPDEHRGEPPIRPRFTRTLSHS